MVHLQGGEKDNRAGKTAQQLGTLAALGEDTGLVPAPMPASSQPTVTTVPGLDTLFQLLQTLMHTQTTRLPGTHTYT